MCSLLNAQPDSINLYYQIGYSDITEEHESQLTEFFESLDQKLKFHFEVFGSADYLGDIVSNRDLSDNRVSKLIHLMEHQYGHQIDSISSVSRGEVDNLGVIDPGGCVQEHRIVTIKINKSSLYGNIDDILELEPGSKLALSNLNFHGARHILMKRSVPTLKRLLLILQQNPELHIEIQGHVCCLDYQKYDGGWDRDTRTYELSENRAKHIYDFLVHKGIDSTRLSHRGFGGKFRLIEPEVTEEDRIQNRRVEILIVSN